jgi:heptosyltransferase-2
MSDRVLVVAPNWLGDAVMALPAIADVRRAFPSATLTIAARPSVTDVFRMAPFVAGVTSPDHIQDARADLGILFPNSFRSAWLLKKAGVPQRWGYRSDLRGRLLTRSVRRPSGSMHQGAYYQHLTRELGIESGPLEPALAVSDAQRDAARTFLIGRGWEPSRALIVFAPGAAYGTAKRWIPAYVARVVTQLVRERAATCVIVGSSGDRPTTTQVLGEIGADAVRHVIDATGATSLALLAGILAVSQGCVANDSGAMHLAAAIGTPLVAPFGPTNEFETAPLTRGGRSAQVLTHPVWCRPCMLRECPIDHRCMKGIRPERVLAALDSAQGGPEGPHLLSNLSVRLPPSLMRPAVFLDRDGTLIEERGYADRLELIELFPWTADAIRLLNHAGFATVVVTNQSAIGHGIIDESFLQQVHELIDTRLAAGGAKIDAYYFCPHHPEATLAQYRAVCRCRKPAPGMIERACREMQLDPARSVMVGDKWLDVACGHHAGTRAVLVRSGHGRDQADRPQAGVRADAILDNLMEAADWILRTCSR